MSLASLPKVELHLHLEGAAPPHFIQRLAGEKDMNLDGVFDEAGNYAFRNFWEFLKTYEAATATLEDPMDFYRLTRAVLEESSASGVVYTEAFLSPDFCGERDLDAWREYLAAIQEAALEAEREDGLIMRGIVTCIRHFGPEKARETALCAAETVGDFIVGFGMGGDEKAGAQSDFAYAFDMAREAGLRLTTHAGEWGGPESIRDALDSLRVERIGHGVRAIEDPALVDRLARDGIVLEVCPGSNVSLGLYPDWNTHPIAKLKEAGVIVTVSTDDPPFFHTDMDNEFEELSKAFGWEEDELGEITEASVDAAFCDVETREIVMQKLGRP